ncbi:hypothetical protein Pcinc_032951 [Petrolisthes cinctipes]|uniref:Uncharacterized protein n=1 Tax=Petrolisthes cinctipes TaxID=88211 RepID=A0AAE1ETA4_PETCI|nr:hypothetical protein Pcinc_032951 [Petrolisthes cinctipes]
MRGAEFAGRDARSHRHRHSPRRGELKSLPDRTSASTLQYTFRKSSLADPSRPSRRWFMVFVVLVSSLPVYIPFLCYTQRHLTTTPPSLATSSSPPQQTPLNTIVPASLPPQPPPSPCNLLLT